MKEPRKFYEALSTIMWSWGGDTPNEACWGFNELLDWYEAETGNIIGLRITEYDYREYKDIIEKFCEFENLTIIGPHGETLYGEKNKEERNNINILTKKDKKI